MDTWTHTHNCLRVCLSLLGYINTNWINDLDAKIFVVLEAGNLRSGSQICDGGQERTLLLLVLFCCLTWGRGKFCCLLVKYMDHMLRSPSTDPFTRQWWLEFSMFYLCVCMHAQVWVHVWASVHVSVPCECRCPWRQKGHQDHPHPPPLELEVQVIGLPDPEC